MLKKHIRIVVAFLASVALVVAGVFAAMPSAMAAPAQTATVKISKNDDNGAALAGARMQITHKNAAGKVVVDDEWTTDGSVHTVDLAAGDYTLTEVSAPEGYTKAEDQTFTVTVPASRARNNYTFNLINSSLRESTLTSNDGTTVVSSFYCFNSTKPNPVTGVQYTEFEGSASVFNQLATQPRGTANELYQNVLRILYNGYPNDNAGIKAAYNLTDEQFHYVTQQAVWYYTDSTALLEPGSTISQPALMPAVLALINSTANLPENMTLDIFESANDQYQHMLTTTFRTVTPPIELTMVDHKAPAPVVEKPKAELANTGSDIFNVAVASALVMMLGAAFVLVRNRMRN
ncbi:thioester-forming surface-anchored protein [Alloscardovia theropitheci]|uniref:Thioester-forming surface-anchored protein n=1 Tax=Alloscardovia theropitheci TaxID=2496842 RepID=A0A4R0QW50_9BIFI|nr:thioester-forming surface-anchored protein [Alloscardovia theropitheci]TCD53710.1 thioester-forming surface-anchored protein [Alloscardovia theropitheci]